MAWTTDQQHSQFEFAVRHMVVSTVRGHFAEFSIDADIDETDLTKSTGTVAVKTASISTREAQRDAHLALPDFFDAEKFPEAHPTSSRRSPAPTASTRSPATSWLMLKIKAAFL